ncbi:MFS transporter [Butyrivibrio sp. INlla14]|uniref:MFS transporter n=1 Tax=Butyrivibrio sp. INlla14 TaxID=1520808 RepID=UPI000876AF8D|nr:MFS transporter [Butyrivibrio sp. INlla14]SCY21150.1 Na+/melibiose symporter [Butyrivibrio sp. INlla14]
MKLNTKRTILIGFAFMSICAFWQFYDNEIPKILKYSFGLGETLTGVVMALDNVLALFLLPLFGTLSDGTDTKYGKRMPYIVVGTIVSTILLTILITVARPSGYIALFVGVLLLLLISMGIYRSPAVSLMPDLTPAPQRSTANAIINLMGTIGGIYILVMIKVLLKEAENPAQTNYIPLMLSLVLFMLVSVLVVFLTIKENKIKEEIHKEGGLHSLGDTFDNDAKEDKTDNTERFEEGTVTKMMPKEVKRSLWFLLVSVFLWFTAYNAVTTAFSRFVGEVWDLHDNAYATCLLVATVAATLSYIPIAYVSRKIGRKKTILIGISLMAASYVITGLYPHFSASINIFFALVGIGWAAINVNSYPMVVEMSKAGEIGKFTGTYYTFSMAAQVFTPIFSGFLLEHISYRTLFPYAFIFSALAFCTMLMVKHGDVKPPKKGKIIDNFDVDD